MQPDSFGDTGPSTLAKAIRDEGEPDAARVLARDGFARGYQRLWMNAGGDQIIVFLYQFATATGASRYYRHSVRNDLSSAPPNATRFAIPGLPTIRSVGIEASLKQRAVANADAATGPFVINVDCNAGSVTGLRMRLISIAREQLNRL
jgi:hypothetical protein